MLFLNLKRIFLTIMFVAGAVTLLVSYNGIAHTFLKEAPMMEKTGSLPVESKEVAQPLEQSAGNFKGDGLMVEYRLQRERSRGQQIELLREIINSPSLGGDTKRLAQEQLFSISKSVAAESRIENLLKAGGYQDAIAYMDENGVTLVVEGSKLTSDEEEKIAALAARESGYAENSIKVVHKN